MGSLVEICTDSHQNLINSKSQHTFALFFQGYSALYVDLYGKLLFIGSQPKGP
jgi:hypothetical protein